MKDLKELKPLWNLIKEEKKKLIIASLFIFIAELSEICTGYLNGAAVEAISNLKIKEALLFLGIYGLVNIVASGLILRKLSANIVPFTANTTSLGPRSSKLVIVLSSGTNKVCPALK